jgi:hypothetical protein
MKIDRGNNASGHSTLGMKIQNVWENQDLAPNSSIKEDVVHEPIIFFVLKGNVEVLINDLGKYAIVQDEMFLIPSGYFCFPS